MSYFKCSKCGKVVSSVIPGGAERVTIRAWIECPECIAAVPDVQQRIAEAVAAERERCCKDVCTGCAAEVPLEFTKRPDGGVRPRPPTWIHWWECGMWTVCGAAAIRERARGGE